jgi:SAM-dependent methyltransferase
MDTWLRDHLVCPRDNTHVRAVNDTLRCDYSHTYECIQNVPIMIAPDLAPTQAHLWPTKGARGPRVEDEYTGPATPSSDAVDRYVQEVVAATNGRMYGHLLNRLTRYPIPNLRLPDSSGQRFLDVGCNWGRWSLSASAKGYKTVGIDPNLDAILAARRVAQQRDLTAIHVVADARRLPFCSDSFDVVFSYSVLQHFAKSDAELAISQARRVLHDGGSAHIQMANCFGLMSLYHQIRARMRPKREFDVRYWSPFEIRKSFARHFHRVELTVDGYLGLGIQAADVDLMPLRYRLVTRASEALRRLTEQTTVSGKMKYIADSLYVRAYCQ